MKTLWTGIAILALLPACRPRQRREPVMTPQAPMPTATADKEVAQEPEEKEPEKPKPEPPPKPTGPTSPAPTDALGFTFGEEHRAVMGECTGHGKTWHKHAPTYSCSEALEGAAFDGEAVLNFCKFRLCGVGMVVVVDGKGYAAWSERFQKMRQTLEEKFGPPSSEATNVPAECQNDGFVTCMDDGKASMEASWEWKEGHKVTLKMSKKQSGDGPSAIRYVAVAPMD